MPYYEKPTLQAFSVFYYLGSEKCPAIMEKRNREVMALDESEAELHIIRSHNGTVKIQGVYPL